MTEVHGREALRDLEHTILLNETVRGTEQRLLLHPYPRREQASGPDRVGFPVRPPKGKDLKDAADLGAERALQRMNEVLARIQELNEALDVPEEVWPRLREAWKRAENEEDPRMAEIVRQAQAVRSRLLDLERRIRRVLRRNRERTSLSRAQELDRASMLWLARQPGQSVEERAGPEQRIMAIVRRENFDTLENRVLHAYCRLAADIAREWLRANPRASGSQRHRQVFEFSKLCRRFTRELEDLGVGIAMVGITPNYVLQQDKSYREVHEAWVLLLRRKDAEDMLWAWQAETWTDFVVLAIVLAIDALPDAQLIAQSPVVWLDEAVTGRWFEQDRPIAAFWLRSKDLVVEVMSRPEKPGTLLSAARAHVALRLTDLTSNELPRRVAVWTPHTMTRMDIAHEATSACTMLKQLQRFAQTEVMRDGLIVTPAQNDSTERAPGKAVSVAGALSVTAIALDASGQSLSQGMAALAEFVMGVFEGAAQ